MSTHADGCAVTWTVLRGALRLLLSAPFSLLKIDSERAFDSWMRDLAPQLDTRDKQKLLRGLPRHDTFIGPSLYVRGAYHKYKFGSTGDTFFIQHQHAERVRASYALSTAMSEAEATTPSLIDAADRTTRAQIEKALDYASMKFAPRCGWDTSNVVIEYCLHSTSGDVLMSCPVGYRWDAKLLTKHYTWDELPFLSQLDRGVVAVMDELHLQEQGGRNHHGYVMNCGGCGGNIVDAVCQFCRLQFSNVQGVRNDFAVPLPRVAVTRPSPIADHDFAINPVHAWKDVFRRWVGPSIDLPQAIPVVQSHQRAITIRSKDLK